MLPGLSGTELIIKIRESTKKSCEGIPIIVVSGKTLEKEVIFHLSIGANDYIKKPFSPAELLARVDRFVIKQEA
jgi:DNA-binding response OmpR family regulator